MKPYPLVKEPLAPVLRAAMPRAARLPSPISALVLPCSVLASRLSSLGPTVFP